MRVRLVLIVLTGLTLTGCGLTSASAPSPHAPDPLPTHTQPQPSAPPTDLPILASRPTSDGATPLDVAVREVRTGTAALTVTISVTNRSTIARRWFVNGFFDDGTTIGPADGGWTADGIAVIDTSAAKRYLPARTADGTCMCSLGLLNTSISAGQTVFVSAIYQAVPPEVTTVAVDVPHAGTFTGIPVSR